MQSNGEGFINIWGRINYLVEHVRIKSNSKYDLYFVSENHIFNPNIQT